jgi:hypothetical protein
MTGSLAVVAALLLLCSVPSWGGAIHEAAGSNDLALVKSLLARSPKLARSTDESGRTPLHIAAAAGNKAMVELLLAKGADVRASDKSGQTAFEAAFEEGHRQVADLIWEETVRRVTGRRPKTGETLDVRVSTLCSLPPQPVKDDSGVNVLIDHGHQTLFVAMWQWTELLRERGFRVVGSEACLDTVLAPGKLSRIRVPVISAPDAEQIRRDSRADYEALRWAPFGWWPNPEFNVIVTYQIQPESQAYLPEEIAAVEKFVKSGGGLVMVGMGVHTAENVKKWPINKLAARFGAAFGEKAVTYGDIRGPSLDLGPSWNARLKAEDGSAVYATRAFGKGRVAIVNSLELFGPREDVAEDSPHSRANVGKFMSGVVRWAAGGKKPVGGTTRVPMEAGGGGGIFPELETRVAEFVVFYPHNQKPELLDLVRNEMPCVSKQVRAWMPSVVAEGPMYFILASGAGGGWAVNVYEPFEVGIISLDGEGILSVFAHELAHNLYGGPPNEKGESAGVLPGVHSEAHAGWFQGKIGALRMGRRGGHDPNLLFNFDKDGKSLDLAKVTERQFHEGWTKLWYVWQKLDDRYGPSWYVRWRWVKNMRWQDEPKRELSWDDVVEDMSIAVGEDLFPFLRKIGTTLAKERFPSAEFLGKTIILPAAPIEVTPAGPARLEGIGDYKQPIRLESSAQ